LTAFIQLILTFWPIFRHFLLKLTSPPLFFIIDDNGMRQNFGINAYLAIAAKNEFLIKSQPKQGTSPLLVSYL